MMMGTIGVMAMNPSIYRDPGYDPERDFEAVAAVRNSECKAIQSQFNQSLAILRGIAGSNRVA